MSSRRGNQRENAVRDHLVEEGWFAMCGRASRGPADILAIKLNHRPLLIQVNSDKGRPWANFRPQERADLVASARGVGGEAWLAWWPPRGELCWMPSGVWPTHKKEEA